MKARRAKQADSPEISRLVSMYAEQGNLLPRTPDEIQANLSRFVVLSDGSKIVACLSLEPYGSDLAEIRSLAVDPDYQRRGLGAKLLEFALQEARQRHMARVFAVTHAPGLFLGQGFATVERQLIREKAERDCRACPKANGCELVAVMMATVSPQRHVLRILPEFAGAV